MVNLRSFTLFSHAFYLTNASCCHGTSLPSLFLSGRWIGLDCLPFLRCDETSGLFRVLRWLRDLWLPKYSSSVKGKRHIKYSRECRDKPGHPGSGDGRIERGGYFISKRILDNRHKCGPGYRLLYRCLALLHLSCSNVHFFLYAARLSAPCSLSQRQGGRSCCCLRTQNPCASEMRRLLSSA